jgi:hypothetical protein
MSQSGPKAILYDEAGNALVGSKVSASSLPVVIASDQAAIPTTAASLPLPTGAATSALQTTGNTSLSSIDTKTPALVGGRQPVDGSGVTQPISAASLPLPTGAATAANQTTLGNQTTKINDGTNTAAVKAASTAPAATDPALVVALSPNTPALPVITTGRTVVGRYGASTGRITGSAAAQNLVSIENPAASGKTLYIRKIKISASCVAAAIVNFQLRLGRTTATPTAGTTQTAQKRATADATPVGIVRSGPTATAATGTLWAAAGPSFQNNPTVYASEITAWDSEGDPSIDISLAATEGLLVSAEANDVDFIFTVSFEWGEA